MIKVVLFDLDGTLIDSELGILDSIEYALGKLGVRGPPREQLRSWIGPPLRATFPLVLGDDADAIERAISLYREHFVKVGWRGHIVYPGIPDAIASLAAAGSRLAIVTSKASLYAGRII